MGLLKYKFAIESTFSPPINYHAFKLRCTPMENEFQRIQDNKITISPECILLEAMDSFGNTVSYGSVSEPHEQLQIISEGVVECSRYIIHESAPNDIYLFPTSLTRCNEEMLAVAHDFKQSEDEVTVVDIMHFVHQHIEYRRFVTDNATTAESAFSARQGVCQDYAHIMTALCRAAGLHARYVAGLIAGEGETHAWVEVYCSGAWQAYDPTYDKIVTEGYIKLAQGRDAGDCPINRGRFYQWTSEQMVVSSVVSINQ